MATIILSCASSVLADQTPKLTATSTNKGDVFVLGVVSVAGTAIIYTCFSFINDNSVIVGKNQTDKSDELV